MRRNAVIKQQQAISRWQVKFGGRRPSEAAMEVATMSTRARRRMFNALRTLGCIEYQGGHWIAVKGQEVRS